MEDVRRTREGTTTPSAGTVPPQPAAPPEGEPLPADGPEAEAAARRASDRRFLVAILVALAALGALALVKKLSTLFLALPILQALVWPMLAARRKGPRELGALFVAPTSAGRAALATGWVLLLASLFTTNENVRLLVCAVLASAAVAAPLARDDLARVRLARELPARSRVGQPTPVRYLLENTSRRSASAVLVRDALGGGAKPVAVEAVFDAVDRGEEASAETSVVFLRRGRRRLRPAMLSARDPLGLFVASFATAAPAETLVHPQEGRATRALIARLAGAAATSGRAIAPPPGLDHLYGVREFREGDDPRRIHWRTTARRGVQTLVDWREERTRRVVVALSRCDGRGLAHDQRFERAVSLAATALRACVAARLPARLVLGSEPAGREPGVAVRGPRGLGAALDALALVRTGGERRPERALERFEAARGSHALVWVSAGGEALAARLAGEGLGAAVVWLRADDPAIARWVRDLP